MTEAERLADQLTRYFLKNTGIFLPFVDATDGLTAVQALCVPQEKFNSVWGVVNHVCYWIEAALLVIQDENKQPETAGRDTGGWHVPDSADDAAWQALRAQTIDLNNQLASAISQLNDEQLHTVKPAWKSTPYQIGQSIISHNSYHICEVITLRHMQGLWVKS
ncbi:MAG: DinB family protein [Anaerolineae bacterium]